MRQRLANAHNLRKDKKKKPILHAEDEFELLKTLYNSTETIFPHELYRVQLALSSVGGLLSTHQGDLAAGS